MFFMDESVESTRTWETKIGPLIGTLIGLACMCLTVWFFFHEGGASDISKLGNYALALLIGVAGLGLIIFSLHRRQQAKTDPLFVWVDSQQKSEPATEKK